MANTGYFVRLYITYSVRESLDGALGVLHVCVELLTPKSNDILHVEAPPAAK